MTDSKIAELSFTKWILTGLVGIVVLAVAWMISRQLFNGVLRQADTPLEQFGVLLFTWILAGVLLMILLAGAGEINSWVRGDD